MYIEFIGKYGMLNNILDIKSLLSPSKPTLKLQAYLSICILNFRILIFDICSYTMAGSSAYYQGHGNSAAVYIEKAKSLVGCTLDVLEDDAGA